MSRIRCAPGQLEFRGPGRRAVVAASEGGTISSEGGALLLRELDRRSGILDRFTACFIDRRNAGYWEHPVRRLLAQRVHGLCLGYEDLNDHVQQLYLFADRSSAETVRADQLRLWFSSVACRLVRELRRITLKNFEQSLRRIQPAFPLNRTERPGIPGPAALSLPDIR